jgi:hypothetical protein
MSSNNNNEVETNSKLSFVTTCTTVLMMILWLLIVISTTNNNENNIILLTTLKIKNNSSPIIPSIIGSNNNNHDNTILKPNHDYFNFTVSNIIHNWGIDVEHATYRYVPGNNTNGKRRTYTGYLKCLANKHILLMGDSRVRSQYLALTSYIAHGKWPRCKEESKIGGNSNNQSVDCFLVRDELPWTEFFNVTNIYLNQNPQAHESCYCYRIKLDGTIRENRFFTFNNPTFGEGPIQISYLQTFYGPYYFGLAFPPFNDPTIPKCKIGRCFHNKEITTPTLNNETLSIIEKLKITHLFASTGWRETDIGCLLSQFEARTGIKSYEITHLSWKGRLEGIPFYKVISQSVISQSCNAKVFDRYTPTLGMRPEQFAKDRLHVLGSANEELNHLLLDILCGK